MAEAKKEKVVLKHKVVSPVDYYEKAQELLEAEKVKGTTRDIALALLYDEYGDKIVGQVDDKKANQVKFVVKV